MVGQNTVDTDGIIWAGNMVIVLDGSLEHGAHDWSELGHLIGRRQHIKYFFNCLDFLYTCTPISE